MLGRLERGESRQSPFERFELVLIVRGNFASLLAVSSAVQTEAQVVSEGGLG